MEPIYDRDGISLYNGDVLQVLRDLPPGGADLVFADPNFNLKKVYGSGINDNLPLDEYYRWCDEWIGLAWKSLKPTGSIFLMTIQEHVGAMWPALAAEGTFKNLIIWKNSSMPVKNRFCVAYQPILWFVRDPKKYTFNYGVEKRVSNVVLPWGRKNNACSIRDIWEDIPFVSGGCISSGEAILEPGTKRKKHACQMPIRLAQRIIGYCSNEGDTVYDLFSGSGTVPMACSIMGRKCVAIEIGREYCGDIVRRLEGPAGEFTGIGDGEQKRVDIPV